MAGIIPATPIVGAPMTGLTSPTFTVASDTPPSGSNGKQYAVTNLGGTQPNVTVSSVDKPFTISIFRPATFARLPPVNPTTGVLPRVQRNVHKVITRKGATPMAGQSSQLILIETIVTVPAGCETADKPALEAAMSAHLGLLWNQGINWNDAVASGLL